MAATELDERRILNEVRTWEPERRLTLARRILELSPSPQVSTPPRQLPLEQVFGLLKTEHPAPGDAECRAILEEERLRKYG